MPDFGPAAGTSIPTRKLNARYLSARNARTHSADTGQPLVALTFDDGPSTFSSDVLAVLQAFRAPAAFFVIGQEVVKCPAIARGIADAGHILGNHSYTHPYLRTLDPAQQRAQLERTQRVLERTVGVTPRWFRPPYGSIDHHVFGLAASLGLVTATWSVDPQDFEQPGVDHLVGRVLGSVQPGSIVLLHDGCGDGGHYDRSQTVEALASILAGLRSRGYSVATLDEMYL